MPREPQRLRFDPPPPRRGLQRFVLVLIGAAYLATVFLVVLGA